MILILYFVMLCVSLPSFVECNFDHDFIRSNSPGKEKKLVNFGNVKSNNSEYRLPTNLEPTLYNLTIIPFLNNATFKGVVNIKINVVSETNEIVLNIRNDTINTDSLNSSVTVFNNNTLFNNDSNDGNVTIENTSFDSEHQMIHFKLNGKLKEQMEVVINIEYEGLLATDMMGFYLSTYKSNGTSQENRMAITQFEGTYARRAFPCFDEPKYRANFTIGIIRPSNLTSMSNMRLNNSVNASCDTSGCHVTEKLSELVWDIYETSPPMPTYLVAFGVSNFSSRSDWLNREGVKIFTRPDAIEDAKDASYVSLDILYSIGNFTGVPYPLKKMDIVAVPDFKAGAMENWGLTTFREKYILINKNKNTYMDKINMVSVIAHEFGHQWFGNLVTPLWWNYTWLNEAFATYFEYTTPNQLFPKSVLTDMYILALQSALREDDGTSDPRPMTSPIFSPNEIENVFDYVIYEKGGSILRMMENYLTTPFWKKGLNIYLTDNAYGEGTPTKLFSALEMAANSKVPLVVETFTKWTTQPGYPLVKLQTRSGIDYLITQNMYKNESSNLTWNIPLTYTTQAEGQFDATKAARLYLNSSDKIVAINTTGWIILNIEQIGYFRVNYEDDNWNKIINQLKSNHSKIGTINRAQLLDDAFNLAKAGYINYSIWMNMTYYLPHETQYLPWKSFFTNMQFLVNQFYGTDMGDRLMEHSRNLLASPFQTFANMNQSKFSFLDVLSQQTIGQFSCDMHLPVCEESAHNDFEKWKQNPYSIVPDQREAMLCTMLRLDSTVRSFQKVFYYALSSDSESEKLMLYRALGCTTNETSIDAYLSEICDVNTKLVRSQNRARAFNSVLSRQSGVAPGLRFLTNNYYNVSKVMGPDIDSLFSTLGSTISQENHIAQVNSLINDTKVDQSLKEKLQSLVIPPVVKRQAWTQSPQALQLVNLLKNNNTNTPSAASISVTQTIYIMVLTATILIHL